MKFLRKIKFYFKKEWIDFLLWLDGIKIKKVRTGAELNQARRLAWDIYAMQKKYIDPNFFPKKIFEDEFDRYSTYFAAFNKGEIIGTVRIVSNSNLGFPIEKLYTLIAPSINKNKITEISRLMVLEDFRKKEMIALGLCKKCFEESLTKGVDYWYAFLPMKLKNYFETYGINFTELKYQKPTPQQQKHREPYRFYFINLDPRPYLISLKEFPNKFRLR